MIKRSQKIIAIPPGETIKEILFDRKMTLEHFTKQMNMSKDDISKLIDGGLKISEDIANRLELILGMPKKFWINLESIYQSKIKRI